MSLNPAENAPLFRSLEEQQIVNQSAKFPNGIEQNLAKPDKDSGFKNEFIEAKLELKKKKNIHRHWN